MSTTAPPRNPIEATRGLAAHAKRLATLELELKTLIVKRKATEIGIGAGFGLLAILLSPLIVLFVLATIAALLATTMRTWLALLTVTGILVVVVAALGAVAVVLTKKATAKGATDA